MSKFDFLETEYSMKKMETPFLGYAGKVLGFYFIVLINHDDSKFCTVKVGAYRDADVESLLLLLKQEKPLKRVKFSVEKASLTIRYRLSLFQSGEKKRFQQHTSELQSRQYLVCRLLLEKKNKYNRNS